MVDDYEDYPNPVNRAGTAIAFGAMCAVPLTSGEEVLGVIGLASGDPSRPFSVREVEALARFGQLASVGAGQRAALRGGRRPRCAHAHATTDRAAQPRRCCSNRLASELIEAAARDQAVRPVAKPSILLDLDRFKIVNESLGHAAGGPPARAVAQRLERAVRPTDTVARLGGDEFAILLGPEHHAARRDARRRADRGGSRARSTLDGTELAVTASLGIAVGDAAIGPPRGPAAQADIAMYRAKATRPRHGRCSTPRCTPRRSIGSRSSATCAGRSSATSCASTTSRWSTLADGDVVGIEALVRWEHPTRGSSALAFIPSRRRPG